MTRSQHSRGGRARRPARTAAALLAAALLAVPPAPYPAGASTGLDSLGIAQTDSAALTSSVMLPLNGGREVLPPVARPFRAGESLKFTVQYGIIHAGSAYLEVPEVREWQGHPVFHLMARAESNSFFNRIYRVRNRIESFWDTTGRYSWRYSEDRREGSHHFKNEVIFDHDRGEARYDNGQTFPIPPQAQDALSAFYYTRFQPLPIGGSIVFDYHADKKSQPLEVRVLGRERIDVPAGKFNCIAIEPVLNAGGIFKSNGRLVIWLTDDERRMPVLMKSKVAIGSISAVLVDARSGS